MVKGQTIASFYRFINYEPIANKDDLDFTATVVCRIEKSKPKAGTKEFSELQKRKALIDEYVSKTGEDTSEIVPGFLKDLMKLDVRQLVPD